eukprot:gene29427-38521_t
MTTNLVVVFFAAIILIVLQYGTGLATNDLNGSNSINNGNVSKLAVEADEVISIHKIEIQENLAEFADQVLIFRNHLEGSQTQVESLLELIHHARDIEGERLNDEKIWIGLNELVGSQADALAAVQLLQDESEQVVAKMKSLYIAMNDIVTSFLQEFASMQPPQLKPLPPSPPSHGIVDCKRWISRFALWKKRLSSGIEYNQLDRRISETLQLMYSQVHHLSNETTPLEVDMFPDSAESVLAEQQQLKEDRSITQLEDSPQEPACSCSCDSFNISFIGLVVQQVVQGQLSLLLDESNRLLPSEGFGADGVDDKEEEEGSALFTAQWCQNYSAPSVAVSMSIPEPTEQCIPPEPCVCPPPEESVAACSTRVDVELDETVNVVASSEQQRSYHIEDTDNDHTVVAPSVESIVDTEVYTNVTSIETSVLKEWSSHTYIPETAIVTLQVVSIMEKLIDILQLQSLYSSAYTYVNSIIPTIGVDAVDWTVTIPCGYMCRYLRIAPDNVGHHQLAIDSDFATISHVSIGHIGRAIARNIDTAPRDFEVYGAASLGDPFIYLGSGSYDITSPEETQSFPLLRRLQSKSADPSSLETIKFITLKGLDSGDNGYVREV